MVQRYLFVSHSSQVAGAEIFMLRLAQGRGDRSVTVLLGEDGPISTRLTELGVHLERRTTPSTCMRGLLRVPALRGMVATWLLALDIRYVCKQSKITLVYTHSAKAHVAAALALPIGRLRIARVAHLHDVPRKSLMGYIARHILATRGSHVIANSRFTAKAYSLAKAVPVYPCMLDQGMLTSPPKHVEWGTITVLSASRIARWKGQIFAIEAYSRWRIRRPELRARLLIVGDAQFGSDRDYSVELDQAIRSSPFQTEIERMGHVDDMSPIYREATCLLHSSLTPEPFGQVIIEALSQGAIPIVPRSGGPLEYVHNGQSGVFYRMGDVENCVDALTELFDHPAAVEKLSQTCLAAASDFYPERVCFDIYRELDQVARTIRG